MSDAAPGRDAHLTTDELSLDDMEIGPVERIAGDFLRVGGSGAPRVLRADGSGKRDTYSRMSNLYRGNAYGLERWKEQQLLEGLQLMIEAGEPIDGRPDKVIRRALELAETHLPAERGTFMHGQWEGVHLARDVERAERDVIAELDRLGFTPEFVEAGRLAYARTLDRLELEVLITEPRCVHDLWRAAGSADAFMCCHRLLLFDDGGVIPAGEVVCEDHKSGQLRRVGGRPQHWLNYGAQIAGYAGSLHYVIGEGDDPDEHREPWPWEVNQHSGLILHFDLLGALESDVWTVTPIRVDLHRGRQLAEHAVVGRHLERTVHAFGFPMEPPIRVTVETDGPSQLEQQLEASIAAVEAAKTITEVEVVVEDAPADAAEVPSAAPGGPESVDLTVEVREWLQVRVRACGAVPAARAALSRRWPAGVAPLRASTDHSDADLAAIERVLDDVEAAHSIPFGPTRPGAPKGGDGWLSQLLTAFPGSTIHTKEHMT